MDVPTHIDALRVDGSRLAEAAALAGPNAPVPSCPDWCLRELVIHQGSVHRWATAYVAEGHTEAGAVDFATARGPEPDDAELIDWFVSGHAALVDALSEASPDLQCWSFLPAPSPLAFWARRQAHETSIHRVDAELAAGQLRSAISSDFAADGIDELLVGFGTVRGGALKPEEVTAVIDVQCTDEDATWSMRQGPEGGVPNATRGAADNVAAKTVCTVRGTAADLYLVLWRRKGPDALDVEGDADAFELALERVRI
jgi:uncharacterized protein (TIGR03083 family)